MNSDYALATRLKIHHVIGRILHLSAAGDHINDILYYMEGTECIEVMPN